MNSESWGWGCEEAVSALAHYIQDKEITKVMVLTFLDGSMEDLLIFFLEIFGCVRKIVYFCSEIY